MWMGSRSTVEYNSLDASHHLGGNSVSQWPPGPSLIWPLSDLISYPHLSFPLCCNNTGVPVPAWTCQTHFLLRPLHMLSLFFFFDSLMSDISMAWSVSPSEGTSLTTFSRIQDNTYIPGIISVCIWNVFLSKWKLLVVRVLSLLTQCF